MIFLEPSLRFCRRHLDFLPDYVVADMGYISLATQRRVREQLHVGIVTKLRSDFEIPRRMEMGLTMRCAQGQKLQWLGLHEVDQLHWFGVVESNPLCQWCWQQSQCPREFCFAASDHEIVFGSIPVNTVTARRLLRQARAWIEATQSYDKNRLGLGSMFLNSLRLAWILSLLADTVSLLRAHACLRNPPRYPLLLGLQPEQLNFDLA